MAAQDRAKKQTDCQTFSLTPATAQERLAYRKTFKKSTVSSQPLAVVYVKARGGKKSYRPQEGSCSGALDV